MMATRAWQLDLSSSQCVANRRPWTNQPDVPYVVPGCGNKIFFLRVMSSDPFDSVAKSELNQMVAVTGATAYAIA
jgi:hypothetical protein